MQKVFALTLIFSLLLDPVMLTRGALSLRVMSPEQSSSVRQALTTGLEEGDAVVLDLPDTFHGDMVDNPWIDSPIFEIDLGGIFVQGVYMIGDQSLPAFTAGSYVWVLSGNGMLSLEGEDNPVNFQEGNIFYLPAGVASSIRAYRAATQLVQIFPRRPGFQNVLTPGRVLTDSEKAFQMFGWGGPSAHIAELSKFDERQSVHRYRTDQGEHAILPPADEERFLLALHGQGGVRTNIKGDLWSARFKQGDLVPLPANDKPFVVRGRQITFLVFGPDGIPAGELRDANQQAAASTVTVVKGEVEPAKPAASVPVSADIVLPERAALTGPLEFLADLQLEAEEEDVQGVAAFLKENPQFNSIRFRNLTSDSPDYREFALPRRKRNPAVDSAIAELPLHHEYALFSQGTQLVLVPHAALLQDAATDSMERFKFNLRQGLAAPHDAAAFDALVKRFGVSGSISSGLYVRVSDRSRRVQFFKMKPPGKSSKAVAINFGRDFRNQVVRLTPAVAKGVLSVDIHALAPVGFSRRVQWDPKAWSFKNVAGVKATQPAQTLDVVVDLDQIRPQSYYPVNPVDLSRRVNVPVEVLEDLSDRGYLYTGTTGLVPGRLLAVVAEISKGLDQVEYTSTIFHKELGVQRQNARTLALNVKFGSRKQGRTTHITRASALSVILARKLEAWIQKEVGGFVSAGDTAELLGVQGRQLTQWRLEMQSSPTVDAYDVPLWLTLDGKRYFTGHGIKAQREALGSIKPDEVILADMLIGQVGPQAPATAFADMTREGIRALHELGVSYRVLKHPFELFRTYIIFPETDVDRVLLEAESPTAWQREALVEDRLYSTSTAASVLGVTQKSVTSMAWKGGIPAHKAFGRHWITGSTILARLEAGQEESSADSNAGLEEDDGFVEVRDIPAALTALSQEPRAELNLRRQLFLKDPAVVQGVVVDIQTPPFTSSQSGYFWVYEGVGRVRLVGLDQEQNLAQGSLLYLPAGAAVRLNAISGSLRMLHITPEEPAYTDVDPTGYELVEGIDFMSVMDGSAADVMTNWSREGVLDFVRFRPQGDTPFVDFLPSGERRLLIALERGGHLHANVGGDRLKQPIQAGHIIPIRPMAETLEVTGDGLTFLAIGKPETIKPDVTSSGLQLASVIQPELQPEFPPEPDVVAAVTADDEDEDDAPRVVKLPTYPYEPLAENLADLFAPKEFRDSQLGFRTRDLAVFQMVHVEAISMEASDDMDRRRASEAFTNSLPVNYILLEGSAQLIGKNGKSMELREGDFVHMPGDTAHAFGTRSVHADLVAISARGNQRKRVGGQTIWGSGADTSKLARSNLKTLRRKEPIDFTKGVRVQIFATESSYIHLPEADHPSIVLVPSGRTPLNFRGARHDLEVGSVGIMPPTEGRTMIRKGGSSFVVVRVTHPKAPVDQRKDWWAWEERTLEPRRKQTPAVEEDEDVVDVVVSPGVYGDDEEDDLDERLPSERGFYAGHSDDDGSVRGSASDWVVEDTEDTPELSDDEVGRLNKKSQQAREDGTEDDFKAWAAQGGKKKAAKKTASGPAGGVKKQVAKKSAEDDATVKKKAKKKKAKKKKVKKKRVKQQQKVTVKKSAASVSARRKGRSRDVEVEVSVGRAKPDARKKAAKTPASAFSLKTTRAMPARKDPQSVKAISPVTLSAGDVLEGFEAPLDDLNGMTVIASRLSRSDMVTQMQSLEGVNEVAFLDPERKGTSVVEMWEGFDISMGEPEIVRLMQALRELPPQCQCVLLQQQEGVIVIVPQGVLRQETAPEDLKIWRPALQQMLMAPEHPARLTGIFARVRDNATVYLTKAKLGTDSFVSLRLPLPQNMRREVVHVAPHVTEGGVLLDLFATAPWRWVRTYRWDAENRSVYIESEASFEQEGITLKLPDINESATFTISALPGLTDVPPPVLQALLDRGYVYREENHRVPGWWVLLVARTHQELQAEDEYLLTDVNHFLSPGRQITSGAAKQRSNRRDHRQIKRKGRIYISQGEMFELVVEDRIQEAVLERVGGVVTLNAASKELGVPPRKLALWDANRPPYFNGFPLWVKFGGEDKELTRHGVSGLAIAQQGAIATAGESGLAIVLNEAKRRYPDVKSGVLGNHYQSAMRAARELGHQPVLLAHPMSPVQDYYVVPADQMGAVWAEVETPTAWDLSTVPADRLYGVASAASMLGVSQSAVTMSVNQGRLEPDEEWLGKNWFSGGALRGYAEKHSRKKKKPEPAEEPAAKALPKETEAKTASKSAASKKPAPAAKPKSVPAPVREPVQVDPEAELDLPLAIDVARLRWQPPLDTRPSESSRHIRAFVKLAGEQRGLGTDQERLGVLMALAGHATSTELGRRAGVNPERVMRFMADTRGLSDDVRTTLAQYLGHRLNLAVSLDFNIDLDRTRMVREAAESDSEDRIHVSLDVENQLETPQERLLYLQFRTPYDNSHFAAALGISLDSLNNFYDGGQFTFETQNRVVGRLHTLFGYQWTGSFEILPDNFATAINAYPTTADRYDFLMQDVLGWPWLRLVQYANAVRGDDRVLSDRTLNSGYEGAYAYTRRQIRRAFEHALRERFGEQIWLHGDLTILEGTVAEAIADQPNLNARAEWIMDWLLMTREEVLDDSAQPGRGDAFFSYLAPGSEPVRRASIVRRMEFRLSGRGERVYLDIELNPHSFPQIFSTDAEAHTAEALISAVADETTEGARHAVLRERLVGKLVPYQNASGISRRVISRHEKEPGASGHKAFTDAQRELAVQALQAAADEKGFAIQVQDDFTVTEVAGKKKAKPGKEEDAVPASDPGLEAFDEVLAGKYDDVNALRRWLAARDDLATIEIATQMIAAKGWQGDEWTYLRHGVQLWLEKLRRKLRLRGLGHLVSDRSLGYRIESGLTAYLIKLKHMLNQESPVSVEDIVARIQTIRFDELARDMGASLDEIRQAEIALAARVAKADRLEIIGSLINGYPLPDSDLDVLLSSGVDDIEQIHASLAPERRVRAQHVDLGYKQFLDGPPFLVTREELLVSADDSEYLLDRDFLALLVRLIHETRDQLRQPGKSELAVMQEAVQRLNVPGALQRKDVRREPPGARPNRGDPSIGLEEDVVESVYLDAEAVQDAVALEQRNTVILLNANLFDPTVLASLGEVELIDLAVRIRQAMGWGGKPNDLQIAIVTDANRATYQRLYAGFKIVEVQPEAGESDVLPKSAIPYVVAQAFAQSEPVFIIDVTPFLDLQQLDIQFVLEELASLISA